MDQFIELLRGNVTSIEGVGVGIAAVLIAALRLLLPAGERRLLRQPVLFAAISAVFFALLHTSGPEAGGRRLVAFLGLLFVLASTGRSAVLLVHDVILGRRLVHPLPKIIRDLSQGTVYA